MNASSRLHRCLENGGVVNFMILRCFTILSARKSNSTWLMKWLFDKGRRSSSSPTKPACHPTPPLKNSEDTRYWRISCGSIFVPNRGYLNWIQRALQRLFLNLNERRSRSEEHTSELQSPCNLV